MNDKEITSSPTGTSPENQREAQWTDDVVPGNHKHRTLILCFDGTGDKFDADVNPAQLPVVSFLKLTMKPRIRTSSNSFRY